MQPDTNEAPRSQFSLRNLFVLTALVAAPFAFVRWFSWDYWQQMLDSWLEHFGTLAVALAFAVAGSIVGRAVGQLLGWRFGRWRVRAAILLLAILIGSAVYGFHCEQQLAAAVRDPAFPRPWPQPDWLIAWLNETFFSGTRPVPARDTSSIRFTLQCVLTVLSGLIGAMIGASSAGRRLVPETWMRRFPVVFRATRVVVLLAGVAGATWAAYELNGLRTRMAFLDECHRRSISCRLQLRLEVSFFDKTLRDRDISALSWFSHDLLLDACQLDTDALRKLAQSLPRLRDLRLRQSDISSAGFRWLSQCQKLKALALYDCQFESDSFRALQCGSVEALTVSGDSITDDVIAAMAGLPKLRSIKIRSNQVTAAGLASLAKLPGLTTVRIRSPRLNAFDLHQFIKQRPDVNILPFN